MTTQAKRPLERFAILAILAAGLLGGSAIAQTSNAASVEQMGLDNQTTANQNGNGNRVDISIVGNDNIETEIRQSGDGAIAELSVVGDANALYVTQSGAEGNYAIGDVRGDSNALFIDQINPESADYRNYAAVRQTGTGHTATVNQTVAAFESSGSNVVAITQEGAGHIGTVGQTGTQNAATLEQYGDYNQGAIFQDGAGHSAELVQNGVGLDAIEIRQSNCAIAGGCPTLRIEQSTAASILSGVVSPGGTATVTQGGAIVVGGGAGS